MKRIGSYWPWMAFIGFLLLLPLAFPIPFVINNTVEILIGALFGVSLNLLIGYTGLLSLGHNAFLGLGSYTAAILLREASFGIPATLLGLFLASGLFALFMGYLCTRLTKFYFAFLTLALSQIIYIIIVRWTSVTGGFQGLKGGIPMPAYPVFCMVRGHCPQAPFLLFYRRIGVRVFHSVQSRRWISLRVGAQVYSRECLESPIHRH